MIRRKGTFGGKKFEPKEQPAAATPAKSAKRVPGKDELYMKDAEYEQIYCTVPCLKNMEGIHPGLHPKPMALRLFKRCKNETFDVIFWSGYAQEWLPLNAPGDMIISTDLDRIPREDRPRRTHDVAKQKADRAAHLPKFQRTKPIPEKVAANGKKVFKGKLGRVNVLLDIGDGSKVCDVPEGTPFADAAKKHKRSIVSQSEATEYAMYVFTEAWKAGRKALRDMAAK
jgi:hypothetical protein